MNLSELKKVIQRIASKPSQKELDFRRIINELKGGDCMYHTIAETLLTATTKIEENLSLDNQKKTQLKDAIQNIASLKLCYLVDRDLEPQNQQGRNIEAFLRGSMELTFEILCDEDRKDACKQNYPNLFGETNMAEELLFFESTLNSMC